MVVILFRSRLADGHDDEYAATSQRMIDLASAMPGFSSFKTFANADGERVSTIEFESEETAAALALPSRTPPRPAPRARRPFTTTIRSRSAPRSAGTASKAETPVHSPCGGAAAYCKSGILAAPR